MTSFNNNTPINNLYAVANANANTAVFVDVFTNRNPGDSDINYQVQKKWFNYASGEFWMLEGFRTANGIVFAVWIKFAAKDHVEFLQGNTGPIIPPDAINTINVVGDGTYITTDGTFSNHTLTIEPGPGLATIYFADAGTATAQTNEVDFRGTSGGFGAGCGVITSAFGHTLSYAMNSPFSIEDFTFSGNTAATPRFLNVLNQSNTSGSDSAFIATAGGATGGDSYVRLDGGNGQAAVFGYQNINRQLVIGTGPSNATAQTVTAFILLRPSNPDLLFTLRAVSQIATASTGMIFKIQNNDTSAGATVLVNCLAGSADSDSWVSFRDTFTSNFYNVGKEGTSQIFKIGYGNINLSPSSSIFSFDPATLISSIDPGNVTMPNTSCVTAVLTSPKTNVTGDGTTYIIPFDDTDVDQNNNFDISTGVFTAPVKGVYLISAAVALSGIGGTNIDGNIIQIQTSLTPYYNNLGNLTAVKDATGGFTAQITSKCFMGVGDTAQIALVVDGGTKTVGISAAGAVAATRFSIQLLC